MEMEMMSEQPEEYMSEPPTDKKSKKMKMDTAEEQDEQKGGYEDGMSWMTMFMYIIHVILAVFAVYTAYSCGSGPLSYLAACCCPYIYLPYVFFTDNSMCGVRGKMAQVTRPTAKAASTKVAQAVQNGGWRY